MNLDKLENQLLSTLEKETPHSLNQWLQSKRSMVAFTEENNLEIIKDAWKSEYTRLNWDSSLEGYLSEALKNYYNYNGQFYWINYDNKKVGYFTIYNINENLNGLGMFCIMQNSKITFGLYIGLFKKFKQFKNIYGFCNSIYLRNLYRTLGYCTKKIQDYVWLISDPNIFNNLKTKKFNADEIF
jgi:hypothetical protein